MGFFVYHLVILNAHAHAISVKRPFCYESLLENS